MCGGLHAYVITSPDTWSVHGGLFTLTVFVNIEIFRLFRWHCGPDSLEDGAKIGSKHQSLSNSVTHRFGPQVTNS